MATSPVAIHFSVHGHFDINEMLSKGLTNPVTVPENVHMIVELSDICEDGLTSIDETSFKQIALMPEYFKEIVELPKGENIGEYVADVLYHNNPIKQYYFTEQSLWTTIANASRYYTGQHYYPRKLSLDKNESFESLVKRGFYITKRVNNGKIRYIVGLMKRLQEESLYLNDVIADLLENDEDIKKYGVSFLVSSCGTMFYKNKSQVTAEEIQLHDKILTYQRAAKIQPKPQGVAKPLESFFSVYNREVRQYPSSLRIVESRNKPKFENKLNITSYSRPQYLDLNRQYERYTLPYKLNQFQMNYASQSRYSPKPYVSDYSRIEIFIKDTATAASGKQYTTWKKHVSSIGRDQFHQPAAKREIEDLIQSGVKEDNIGVYFLNSKKTGAIQPVRSLFRHLKTNGRRSYSRSRSPAGKETHSRRRSSRSRSPGGKETHSRRRSRNRTTHHPSSSKYTTTTTTTTKTGNYRKTRRAQKNRTL